MPEEMRLLSTLEDKKNRLVSSNRALDRKIRREKKAIADLEEAVLEAKVHRIVMEGITRCTRETVWRNFEERRSE
jgi:benzoyl-CoA reductase/2-hydroxyglutaryl-CoA dehydratase subunit BcrC/BadD/HgdB